MGVHDTISLWPIRPSRARPLDGAELKKYLHEEGVESLEQLLRPHPDIPLGPHKPSFKLVIYARPGGYDDGSWPYLFGFVRRILPGLKVAMATSDEQELHKFLWMVMQLWETFMEGLTAARQREFWNVLRLSYLEEVAWRARRNLPFGEDELLDYQVLDWRTVLGEGLWGFGDLPLPKWIDGYLRHIDPNKYAWVRTGHRLFETIFSPLIRKCTAEECGAARCQIVQVLEGDGPFDNSVAIANPIHGDGRQNMDRLIALILSDTFWINGRKKPELSPEDIEWYDILDIAAKQEGEYENDDPEDFEYNLDPHCRDMLEDLNINPPFRSLEEYLEHVRGVVTCLSVFL